MADNRLGITKENIKDSKTFEKILNSNNLQLAEKELFDLASQFRCKSSVEKQYLAYKKIYLDNYNVLDFGKNAPIQKLAGGEYSIVNGCIYDFQNKLVCSQLVQPIRIYKNIEENTENVEIAFLLDGKWENFIAERAKLLHNGKIVEFTKKGLDVSTGNSAQMVRYLQTIINKNRDVFEKKESISRLGWYKDKFIPYDTEVVCDCEDDFREKINAFGKKGDYNIWLDKMYEVRVNRIVRILHATSLASVLLHKLNKKPFVTMVWGTTGDAKTVAAMTAMSIWGNPDTKSGLFFMLNNTDNFNYRTAHFFHDVPVLFDELESLKNDMFLEKLIMTLTEGVDRGKAKAEGGVQASKSWNNAFIMTGEHTASKLNSGGGSLNRLIEINSDGKIIEDGPETVNVIVDNYGFGGEIFIKGIMELDKEELKDLYNKKFKELKAISDTEEKQALNMALILLADELGCRYIFKNNTPLTAEDVKDYMFKKEEINVSERAYELIIDECSSNISRFKTYDSAYNESPYGYTGYGEFWGKLDTFRIVINKSKLLKLLEQNGFSFKKTMTDWHKMKLVEKNSAGKYYTKTSVCGISNYYVTIKIREEDRFDIPTKEEIEEQKLKKANAHINNVMNTENVEYYQQIKYEEENNVKE